MRRTKLRFTGLTIDFIDYEKALKKALNWVDKGVSNVELFLFLRVVGRLIGLGKALRFSGS